MNLSRRGLGGLFAGVAGIAGAKAAGVDLNFPSPIPPSVGEAQGRATMAEIAKNSVPPLMSRGAAVRLALLDPDIRELFDDHVRTCCHTPERIDPDIVVMKSFSPMFKVTLQRQRDMEKVRQRLLAEFAQEEGLGMGKLSKLWKIIHKFQWGRE